MRDGTDQLTRHRSNTLSSRGGNRSVSLAVVNVRNRIRRFVMACRGGCVEAANYGGRTRAALIGVSPLAQEEGFCVVHNNFGKISAFNP